MAPQQDCVICGEPIPPRPGRQITCGQPACRRERRRETDRGASQARYWRRRFADRRLVCVICGDDLPPGHSRLCDDLECRRQRDRTLRGRPLIPPERTCPICQRPLPLDSDPQRRAHEGFCSRVYRAAYFRGWYQTTERGQAWYAGQIVRQKAQRRQEVPA